MHESVLVKEINQLLDPKPGCRVLDATVGSGGHAEAFLERIFPEGLLLGLDQDLEAIRRSSDRLSRFGNHVLLVQSNFRQLDKVLEEKSIPSVDRVLFDLGVSSEQFSTPERGFSFMNRGPLDMRMDLKSDTRAADLINTLSEQELADIFWKFGEEHRSRRFARAVVEARKGKFIDDTQELAKIIRIAAGRRGSRRIHPATKVFQALRIVVNDELEAIREALGKAVKVLNPRGRIAVISFHSLEDRIIKNFFKQKVMEGELKILTRKVVRPSQEEILRNPKARSAKLRVAEKI